MILAQLSCVLLEIKFIEGDDVINNTLRAYGYGVVDSHRL